MAASAVRGSVRGMVRRLSQFGRSPKVSPDNRPQPLIQGKKLTERIWLPDLKAETLDVNSSQLQNLARQVTVAIGAECRLVATHMSSSKGAPSHLLGLAKADILIGMYEAENNKDGILLRRICDHPVREFVRLDILPSTAEWPKKYEPLNTYGGNRKLPSRASAADLMVDIVAPEPVVRVAR